MNRLDVRAEAQGHQENEDTDIAQALKQLLGGKKPTGDDARFDRFGGWTPSNISVGLLLLIQIRLVVRRGYRVFQRVLSCFREREQK